MSILASRHLFSNIYKIPTQKERKQHYVAAEKHWDSQAHKGKQ